MPSVSLPQHRWIEWLAHTPEARAKSGMSQAKVEEWAHADKGSPWRHETGGAVMRRDLMPDDLEFDELKNRGWHAYMRGARTGDPHADPNMTAKFPSSNDDIEIDRGRYGGLGGRTDYDPDPQGSRRGGGISAPHYDDGGAAAPAIGGAQPSVQTANPMVQGMIQRYSQLPTEKLTELAAHLQGTPQGPLIQRLLQQRRMMPNTAPQPAQPAAPQPAAQQQAVALPQIGTPGQGFQRGGTVKRDIGGMMPFSQADPWWTRAEARGADSGLLAGTTPGRADAVKTQAPPGAFVVPAEVVAGLGEGNTLSGARVIQGILDSGPHGIPQARMGHGRGPPRPPEMPRGLQGELKKGGPVTLFEAKARGGGQEDPGKTPVDLSHGEFIISPEHVKAWGGGDTEAGIRIWNKWTWQKHKEHLAKLKEYKGPVGMKKADKT